MFRTWWLADFSGALVFAPLLLVWAARRSWRMPGLKVAEGALLLAVLIVLDRGAVAARRSVRRLSRC